MRFVGPGLAVLSAVLMAAHALRAGQGILALLALATPALLLLRRPWAVRGLQVALLVSAVEWGRTLGVLVHQRLAAGDDWLRLALILGTVAVVPVLAALALEGRARSV